MLPNEAGVRSIKASLGIPWWRLCSLMTRDSFLDSIFPEFLRLLGVDTQ